MREPQEPVEEKRYAFSSACFAAGVFGTIHWTKTYGVLGYEETTQMEDFILA